RSMISPRDHGHVVVPLRSPEVMPYGRFGIFWNVWWLYGYGGWCVILLSTCGLILRRHKVGSALVVSSSVLVSAVQGNRFARLLESRTTKPYDDSDTYTRVPSSDTD